MMVSFGIFSYDFVKTEYNKLVKDFDIKDKPSM
jgi:hypothetical protein